VILNLNLFKYFLNEGWEIYYLGSETGIERELIKDYHNVHYISIPTGKLRRYISIENLKDMFKVLRGIVVAYKELKKINPEILFSKGGFVSVPVIIASKFLKIKSFIHESDMTIGLANRIAYLFCSRMFTTFLIPYKKAIKVGAVVDPAPGNGVSPFENTDKPVLLVIGGSQGAKTLNTFVENNYDKLVKLYNVLHISGEANKEVKKTNYYNISYYSKGLGTLIKSSDIILSRAGSNSIFEILQEKKLNILVPLPLSSSRGDQLENAKYFKEKGYSYVISDDKLTWSEFELATKHLSDNREAIYENLKATTDIISTEKFYNMIRREL
ncbi:UDP-N-acetylglucosamine--N-acetylmuramyl-(pentapeptide) pyrophosphoryl-undecaprenol N-acetylglucosamine transferase, partial [Listeria monocytogenes]|nr:UDP-N-acetylglucosamine--N-acetylmuramyl-(pentapeptide) pyrophosphoryl-undecaprenol N-acetylglucosamine transferase [Listeria monocytogenes]